MGRDFRSHIDVSRRQRHSFKASGNFFGTTRERKQGGRYSRRWTNGLVGAGLAGHDRPHGRRFLPPQCVSALDGSGPRAVGTDGPELAARSAAVRAADLN